MSKSTWAAILIGAGLLLAWAIPTLMPVIHESLYVAETPRGGDFTLNTRRGLFRLQGQRGKVVLIYFGYTFCPDVCPTNLALMAQALNALTEEELKRVQGVFISVDPERDTLDHLAAYTKNFHSSIVGVTGSPGSVAHVAKQYGAAYHRVEGESRGGYLVDHSSNTYVVAPDGSLARILPHATPPREILQAIRELLPTDKS